MFKLASAILLLGGIIILMVSAWRGVQTWRLLEFSGHAPGEVIELIEKQGPNNSIAWSPRVTFITPAGSVEQFISSSSAAPARYTVGQRVNVRYSLSAGAGAEINDWSSLWGDTFALALLALGLCAIGGITYWLESAGVDALLNIDTGKLVGTVFSIIGPLLLLGAVVQASSTVTFMTKSQTAPGVVERVEIIYAGGASSSFSFYPVVLFEAGGRNIHIISEVGAYPANYQVGEQVMVRYLPEFPELARINAWLEIWSPALVSAAIGIVCTLLGWMVLRFLAGVV